MIRVTRAPPGLLTLAGVTLVSIGLGCPGDRVGAYRRIDVSTLRHVELPALGDFPESTRTQLQAEHARLQRYLRRPGSDPRRLGEAFGGMGQLLLAYEFHDAAEPALLNAADLMPEDFRWPYYLGYAYKQSEEPEAAVRWFERALGTRPDDVPTRLHLAESLIALGRASEAEERLREAIEIDSTVAAAHFLLGHIVREADPDRAISHYRTALSLQPDASVVHYPLSLAYRQLGDLERSREHLARRGDTYIAVRDPLLQGLEGLRRGPEAKLRQGAGALERGDLQAAASAFAAVVAEDSTNVAGYLNLGVTHAQAGRYDDALRALRRAVALDSTNSRAHYNLGLLFRALDDPDRALRHFDEAAEHDPNNWAARFALAESLWERGECRGAIPHLDALLSQDPAHVRARIRLAMCHARLGASSEARRLLEEGHQAFPRQPELLDALVRLLSASRDSTVRDGAHAVTLAERLTSAVRRPETLESLAMAYAEAGRFPDAIRAQQEAIERARTRGDSTAIRRLRQGLERYRRGEPTRGW